MYDPYEGVRRHRRQHRIRYMAPKEIDVDILTRNFSDSYSLDEMEVRQSDGVIKQTALGLSITSDNFTPTQSKVDGGIIYSVPPPGFDPLRGVFVGYIPVILDHTGIPTTSSSSQPDGRTAPSRFYLSSPSSKFLFLFKNIFELGRTEMVFSVQVRAKQLFKQGSEIPRDFKGRVRNIHSDYRLCSAGPILFDSNTGLEFAMLVTDQVIYALYSRGTVMHEPTPDTAQFCCVKEIYRKTGAEEDFITLGIGLDRITNRVRYYIDKTVIFEINKLGRRLEDSVMTVDHGGAATILTPQSVRFGYGHFTFLDHQWPGSNLVHVDKTTDPNSIIYRSESGLCSVRPAHIYKEIIPDMLGRSLPIIPRHSFAAGDDHTDKFKYFGQGMISDISEIFIVEKQTLYERISGDKIIDDITLE